MTDDIMFARSLLITSVANAVSKPWHIIGFVRNWLLNWLPSLDLNALYGHLQDCVLYDGYLLTTLNI